MSKTIHAIYENGSLKPLEKLDLPEHQKVTLRLIRPTHSHRSVESPNAVQGMLEVLHGPLPTRSADEMIEDSEPEID